LQVLQLPAQVARLTFDARERFRTAIPKKARTGMKSASQRLKRTAATALPLFLAGCSHQGILDSAGPVSAGERTIMLNSIVIMLAIVIPTIIAALGFAWWFRADKPRGSYRPDWAYSGRVELVVWSIPILVILFLSGVIWVGSHQLDPYSPLESQKRTRPLEVQVVSLDWKWLFIYPEQGVATVNTLVLPTGVPVHFSLTSASVMNVFFVHRLGSMIYTMNGMVSQLNLQADRAGDYYGQSAQFSGDGFSDMNFVTHAVTPAQFNAWIATHKGKAPALDEAAYAQLSKQGVVKQPIVFGSAAAGLFDRIAQQKIAPQPGPQVGRPEAQVSPRTAQ
jgi:cytochrome o ubiquinol oxidase subunit 2